jgi:NADH-quinone oxidoreductase subunit J
VVNVEIIIGIIAVICALLSVVMLFSREALTCALCLLGILLGTAGIYGLMGEHFIATVQLVVYAGAIMVLFVFSVMLLNIQRGEKDFTWKSTVFWVGLISGLILLGVGTFILKGASLPQSSSWTHEMIEAAGGNTRLLSHALFAKYYVSFEAVALPLMVALIGAVTLAKRKID